MGYFTVIATSNRNGYVKTYRGVKAKNKYAAVDLIAAKLCKSNKWTYDVYMSKHRPRRYKHAKHTRKIRRPWAVLAKNAKRQHFNVLNRWSNLHYHRLTYMAWLDDAPQVFPVMDTLKDLFDDIRTVDDLAGELAEAVDGHVENPKEKVEEIVHAYYEREAR
jgi:hypothetical protein